MKAIDALQIIDASKQPFLLDGGLGSEVEKRGFDVTSNLWNAELLFNNPEALQQIHLDYLKAGARCITTASYQASVPGLRARGLSLDECRELLLRSVAVAVAARDQFIAETQPGYQPLIAASVGCYGAYLADGSEYRGNYAIAREALLDFHRQRLHWLDRSDADLIACETIPDRLEAEVLAELLGETNTPAWISFCCRDGGHLHDASPIEAVAALFAEHPTVFALGINCSAIEHIDALILKLKLAAPSKRILVYPNSGEQYDAVAKCWHGDATPHRWPQLAKRWQQLGASMVGGCCRIGPEHIQAIARGFEH